MLIDLGCKMTKNICLGMIILAVLVGCKSGPEYDIGVKNIGTQTIESVSIQYDKSLDWQGRINPGTLAPGIFAIDKFIESPIPDTATVQWRTEDDQLRKKEIEVKKNVPKNFKKGAIWFEIGDNDFVNVIVNEKPNR